MSEDRRFLEERADYPMPKGPTLHRQDCLKCGCSVLRITSDEPFVCSICPIIDRKMEEMRDQFRLEMDGLIRTAHAEQRKADAAIVREWVSEGDSEANAILENAALEIEGRPFARVLKAVRNNAD